jgi:hypothetical protein
MKHSAITWMISAGKSFEDVAQFTNTSKEIIQKLYGKFSPERAKGLADAVTF